MENISPHLIEETNRQERRSRSVNKWLVDDILRQMTFPSAWLEQQSFRRHSVSCIRIYCLLGNMSGAGPLGEQWNKESLTAEGQLQCK